jgi:hypothetical protein
MRTELKRRLTELEQQADPEVGQEIVNVGNGIAEIRWNGIPLVRTQIDDPLLDGYFDSTVARVNELLDNARRRKDAQDT